MGKHPGTSGGVNYMKGMEALMIELNKEVILLKERSMKGLINSAAYIYRKTESEAPLTPVDTGNMRASWFVVTANSTPVGRGNPDFRGPTAEALALNHNAVLTEVQGDVKSRSVGNLKFLTMGYSVNYSGFVHEMIGANFNPEKRKGKRMRREGAGPKWLETAISKNKSQILRIIAETSKIGK